MVSRARFIVSGRLKNVSIKGLYPYALAEGEGVGTAYEYFAKRLVLRRWIAKLGDSGSVLIAGLPEKYGSSLDFLLLAEELGRKVVIVDERPEAIEKAKRSLAEAQKLGLLTGVSPRYKRLESFAELSEVKGQFGLCIGSEVLQRLDAPARQGYWDSLRGIGPTAVFAPNADNPGHTNLSGLNGLHLDELRGIVGTAVTSNYIDMPPFPPGMTRTDDQREHATSGNFEAFAMWGLGWYARMERFIPMSIRRKQAHIVFALSG